jgi:hypothetical protein
MLAGLGGMVAQGMALGTGSALAHKAVDSVMGGGGGHAPAAAPEPAQHQQSMPTEGPCAAQAKTFSECMSNNFGDMGTCQQYFDAMQACKRSME